MTGPFERALLGLLPALGLLAVLVYVDAYKLVRLRAVVALLASGALVAAATYALSRLFLERFPMPLPLYSRYVAPVAEELLKALVVVALVRAHRIGFLVDAAICGFAVGTGFGVAENLYYLHLLPEAGLGLFLVRGFGTALMHGGATAIFGVLGLASLERRPDAWVRAFLPGLLLAVALHSAFNHFFLSPLLSTCGIVLVLPILFQAIFARSERSLGDWIGQGFDADVATLETMNSGRFTGSPAGRYLDALKERFEGPVVADLLCYLQLHIELSLRAKGVLLMRESGFAPQVDEATRAAFEELRYLGKSVGRTGLRAIRPMLGMTGRELWQLHMLDR
jgi:RsiW-degrading membrane proteinase PrsW (M82 family)